MTDRLRTLWDFEDLETTEARFRDQLEQEAGAEGRAEVLTQLARVEGLRDRFDSGEQLLRDAESLVGSHPRIDLERGRLLRSSGRGEEAFPLFVAAFEAAGGFIAGDAAHMAALVDPEGPHAWTARGLELAERDPDAAYWAGPLLNNIGWHHVEAGEPEAALVAFEQALAARERGHDEHATEIARYAVAKTLHALGRDDEALPLLERAVAWTRQAGIRDQWFEEELAAVRAGLEQS